MLEIWKNMRFLTFNYSGVDGPCTHRNYFFNFFQIEFHGRSECFTFDYELNGLTFGL